MSIEVLGQEVQIHYTMGRGEVGVSCQSTGDGKFRLGFGLYPIGGEVGSILIGPTDGDSWVDFFLEYPDIAELERGMKTLNEMIKRVKKKAKAAQKKKAKGGDND